MAKRRTFDAEKEILDQACETLRSFTLASRGASRKSGLRALARVNAACEQLSAMFSKGPDAARLASVLQSVRGRVLAAEARLALLARNGGG